MSLSQVMIQIDIGEVENIKNHAINVMSKHIDNNDPEMADMGSVVEEDILAMREKYLNLAKAYLELVKRR